MYIASLQETERVHHMGGATQPTGADGGRRGSNLPTTSPTQDAAADISEMVQERVTKHLRKALILDMITTEQESRSDDEAREPWQKRKALKSGKIWTANTMVVKQITWPHKLVYGVD